MTNQTVNYFSPRGKKIAILIGAVVGAYIVYRIAKSVIKGKGASQEVQEANTELDRLNTNPATAQKITEYQAQQMANSIFYAVNGYGTDEEQIYSVFRRMSNNADFIAVSKAFGIRTISTGRFNPDPDYKATMTQALQHDLSTSEKKKVNEILVKKNIRYKI